VPLEDFLGRQFKTATPIHSSRSTMTAIGSCHPEVHERLEREKQLWLHHRILDGSAWLDDGANVPTSQSPAKVLILKPHGSLTG